MCVCVCVCVCVCSYGPSPGTLIFDSGCHQFCIKIFGSFPLSRLTIRQIHNHVNNNPSAVLSNKTSAAGTAKLNNI